VCVRRPVASFPLGVAVVFLRVGGVLFVILLGIWLYCLLDAITTDETRVRNLPKLAWVLIVLLLLDVGAVAWLVAGRPRGKAAQGSRDRRRPGPAGPASRRQLPPDDDPEFLAQLDRRQDEGRRRDDEHHWMLDRWETELRRREEKRRGREQDKDDKSDPEDPPR
jgi:Phospholipase_D-nuclease N-terminal